MLQVLNSQHGAFDERDEQRLRAVAAQAASALDNARLFEDVLNLKNYDESILKSLTNGVISLDSQLELTKLNRAALTILACDEDTLLAQSVDEVFTGANAWLAEMAVEVRETHEAQHALDVDTERQIGRAHV